MPAPHDSETFKQIVLWPLEKQNCIKFHDRVNLVALCHNSVTYRLFCFQSSAKQIPRVIRWLWVNDPAGRISVKVFCLWTSRWIFRAGWPQLNAFRKQDIWVDDPFWVWHEQDLRIQKDSPIHSASDNALHQGWGRENCKYWRKQCFVAQHDNLICRGCWLKHIPAATSPKQMEPVNTCAPFIAKSQNLLVSTLFSNFEFILEVHDKEKPSSFWPYSPNFDFFSFAWP